MSKKFEYTLQQIVNGKKMTADGVIVAQSSSQAHRDIAEKIYSTATSSSIASDWVSLYYGAMLGCAILEAGERFVNGSCDFDIACINHSGCIYNRKQETLERFHGPTIEVQEKALTKYFELVETNNG